MPIVQHFKSQSITGRNFSNLVPRSFSVFTMASYGKTNRPWGRGWKFSWLFSQYFDLLLKTVMRPSSPKFHSFNQFYKHWMCFFHFLLSAAWTANADSKGLRRNYQGTFCSDKLSVTKWPLFILGSVYSSKASGALANGLHGVQINIVGSRIPTGRRQNSWSSRRVAKEMKLELTRNKLQLAVRANLNSGSLNCKSSTLTNPLATYISRRSQ